MSTVLEHDYQQRQCSSTHWEALHSDKGSGTLLPPSNLKKSHSSPDLSEDNLHILSLLGLLPSARGEQPTAKNPSTPALPTLFYEEVKRMLHVGEISPQIARYYSQILPRGDSRQIPGQNGNRSLLEAVLTEDVKQLTRVGAPGSGWRPIRALGKGAYGAVILWENKQNPNFPIRLASKDTACSSFFKDYCAEAHLTRRLNDLGCRNVINVVEWRYVDAPIIATPDGTVSREPSRNRICYEYAEYSDLSRLERWYRRHKLILPEAFIWQVLSSVASALCYCRHGSGSQPWKPGWDTIVHGDIKEANIFMTQTIDNENALYPCLKLGDFGLAYTLGGSIMAVQHFRSLQVYGTDGYIAPEVADQTPEKSGRRRLPYELHGPHSDIYSLGMTCQHLVSLVDAHRRPTDRGPDLSSSCVDRPPNACDISGIYSEALTDLLDRCTAPDPRQRPKISRLLQFCRSQAEIYGQRARAEATLVQSEHGILVSADSVLYTPESQARFEKDQRFQDHYRHANLGRLSEVCQGPELERKRPNKPGLWSAVHSFKSQKGSSTSLEKLFHSVLKRT